MKKKVTTQQAAACIKAFEVFLSDAENYFIENGNEYQHGSHAEREVAEFPSSNCVVNAYCQGQALLEVVAEHGISLTRLFSLPMLTIAPWTSVRSLLEAAALATWVLDYKITSRERVQRGFALRYEGLDQQRKIARHRNQQGLIDKIDNRIIQVEQEAISLGFAACIDGKGRRLGIGQEMPNATPLIGAMLNRECDYRIGSMVAHGHLAAIQQIGFEIGEPQDPNSTFSPVEKKASPFFVQYLCFTAFHAAATPLWHLSRLFELAPLKLEEVLEETADSMNLTMEPRFWRMS